MDDARRIILTRRARFVAATLAGVGFAQGCATQSAVCLSPPVIEIDSGTAEPEPAPADEPDAGLEPEPQVCLEIAEPRPCLEVQPDSPRTDAGPRKAPPPRICLSEY